MSRILVCSAVLLLATQVAFAAVTTRKVIVDGQLTGGAKVQATCTVSSTGQASGTGKFSGPGYSYPFTINKVTSGTGTLTFSGNFTMAGAYPVTLTVSVPSGNQTFKYVINGKTVTLTGPGTPTIQ